MAGLTASTLEEDTPAVLEDRIGSDRVWSKPTSRLDEGDASSVVVDPVVHDVVAVDLYALNARTVVVDVVPGERVAGELTRRCPRQLFARTLRVTVILPVSGPCRTPTALPEITEKAICPRSTPRPPIEERYAQALWSRRNPTKLDATRKSLSIPALNP